MPQCQQNEVTEDSKISGGKKSRKSRKPRTRKWTLKYKKSINCKSPKGFSQRQYCKYGRK